MSEEVSQDSDKGAEASIQFAKKYVEDVLSFFGLNTDVYATSEDGTVIELSVPSTHLNGFLIGQRGDTLRSIQYLISSALQNQGYEIVRVSVDVADYKRHHADRISQTAESWIEKVKQTGEPFEVKSMNAADRRTIHRLAAEHGLTSDSEGDGRDRHIVLRLPKE